MEKSRANLTLISLFLVAVSFAAGYAWLHPGFRLYAWRFYNPNHLIALFILAIMMSFCWMIVKVVRRG